jgi:MarR family transcriptional regulator, organic hydroperoxide resistance regulator
MARGRSVDPVGQALILAARRHRARQAILLSEIGLFPGQDQVLLALLEDDGLTMSEIAAELQIRPPTASKMAARMGAQGLVERRSSDADARLVTIHITDDGRALGERLKTISRKLEKQLLVEMDDKDTRRLRRLLKRAARNLKPDGAMADEPDTELDEADAA